MGCRVELLLQSSELEMWVGCADEYLKDGCTVTIRQGLRLFAWMLLSIFCLSVCLPALSSPSTRWPFPSLRATFAGMVLTVYLLLLSCCIGVSGVMTAPDTDRSGVSPLSVVVFDADGANVTVCGLTLGWGA